MKIVYLSPTFPPISAGMGTACFYTANNIGQSNSVTVFLANRHLQYNQGNYQLKIFKPWFSYGYANFAPQLFWQLKNFDIVHIYYPYFGAVEPLCFFKKIFRKKYPHLIFHYQMDMHGQGLTKIINQLHQKFIAPFLFKYVDLIFVLSEDYAKNSFLKKYYLQYPNKFKVVPNGVDLHLFQPKKQPTQTAKETSKIFTIFTAQALDRQHYFKGIDVLIKALKIINNTNVQLKIAGNGDLKKSYQDLVKELNLTSQVFFLGQLSHKDLPSHYQQADLVVVPSTKKTESFSITAAEAMACGLPVVVSDLPGLRVTPENNISGLLAIPNNEKDLAEKILFFINQPDKIISMGQSARERAEKLYDWQKICQNIESYYQSLS